ncbi:MAG: hypothetical protein M1816_003649 [Peltula sp. TS41687]|nr:MAG: hypothetical protein M1816_003649 [Peltula sp. TS41687]
MTGRVTRAAAARALVAAGQTPTSFDHLKEMKAPPPQQQQLSSPPATPSPTKKTRPAPRSAKGVGQTTAFHKAKEKPTIEPRTPLSNRKRKRGRATAAAEEGDINELPHNLGKAYSNTVAEETKVENGSPAPKVPKVRTRQAAGRRQSIPAQGEEEFNASQGKESDAVAVNGVQLHADELLKDPAVVEMANSLIAETEASPAKKSRKAKKPKANPYGLTPGETPFPDWPHPTPEECQEVNDLLSNVHGEVKAPATIPAPSTTVSGCGEVPSILDALIRTLLSAATTGTNSSRAFKGLVDTFGILGEGIGKGSVDWDRVRRADVQEVFKAIKTGGLAATKSKRIKEILDIVYAENQARRDAFVKAKEEEDNHASEPAGAENETASEKKNEVARAEQHVLSLDHLHALSSDDALNALIKYPGIGPKTASCVLLFCMQRPSFAVDTHVFRLCKWLNWVPEKANRNSTYSHCEVRVPDHLKYSLHQLMIRHGKTCPRCRAATGEGSEDWDKGCPIDHLIPKRTGKRKGGAGAPGKKKQKKDDEEDTDADGNPVSEEADEADISDQEETSDVGEEEQSGDEEVEEEK